MFLKNRLSRNNRVILTYSSLLIIVIVAGGYVCVDMIQNIEAIEDNYEECRFESIYLEDREYKDKSKNYKIKTEKAKTEKEYNDLIQEGEDLLIESILLNKDTVNEISSTLKENKELYKKAKSDREEKERLEKERLRIEKEKITEEENRRVAELNKSTSNQNKGGVNKSSAPKTKPSPNVNATSGKDKYGYFLPSRVNAIISDIIIAPYQTSSTREWGYSGKSEGDKVIRITEGGVPHYKYVVSHEAGHMLDFEHIEDSKLDFYYSYRCGPRSCTFEWREIFEEEWAGRNLYGALSYEEAFAEAFSWYIGSPILEKRLDGFYYKVYPGDIWSSKPRSAAYIQKALSN